MIFTTENALKVIRGQKTLTRRVVKDGEASWTRHYPPYPIDCITGVHGRIKWRVGKSYAVQPARGKRAIGRRVLKTIRRERLQDITLADIVNEGVVGDHGNLAARFAALWDSINTRPGTRWEDNPWVWVLEFGEAP